MPSARTREFEIVPSSATSKTRMCARVGVVDVEQRLVGREAQPVGLVEVVDEQLRVAAARRDAVDALEVEVLLALDAEAGHAPVGRVGEVDRAVALDHDVVGAVELPALVVGGEHLAPAAPAVGVHAHDRARDVLADDEPPVVVDRHPVALVGRVGDLGDPRVRVPAPAHVAGHVAEEQEAVGVPDRPLGEGEAGPDLLDLGALVDQLAEGVRFDLDSHGDPSPNYRLPATGREPNRCRYGDGRAIQRPCRRSILVSRPASASRLARLWPATKRSIVRQRGAHAGGQRLVVRAALDRVDPDDRVGRAVQPRHLAPDELVVLALPAVGGDQHHRAAGQRAPPPDVVVALQRSADARPAGPVDHAVGRARQRDLGVARAQLGRSGASGACRRRRPRRRAPSGPSRAGRAAARGCRAPSSPTRRTERRACAASACAGESAGAPGRRRSRSRRAPARACRGRGRADARAAGASGGAGGR